ncbi:MAG: hypothetical protein JWM36_3187 [Hyphomicrobiales bacterium]|nr:hypothetical protein [Hyphomicrobiales bacterium]
MSAADDAWRLVLKRNELTASLNIIEHASTYGSISGGQLAQSFLQGVIFALVEIMGEEATFNIVTRAANGIGARLVANVPPIGKE